MVTRTPAKHTRQGTRQVKATKSDGQNRLGEMIQRYWKTLLALASGGAVVLAYELAFAPAISLDASSEGADLINPFNQSFTLTNGGSFSLYSVKATCDYPGFIFKRVDGKLAYSPDEHFHVKWKFIAAPSFSLSRMEPRVPRTFVCDDVGSLTQTEGPPAYPALTWISIGIEYRLAPFTWTSSKWFGFEGFIHDDHKIHWQPSLIPRNPLNPTPAASTP